MDKKILIVKRGSFSEVNTFIINNIKKEFPDYKVDVFDIINDFLNKKPFLRKLNWLFMYLEYGFFLNLRKKNVYKYYHATSFLFKRIKKAVNKHVKSNNYTFTFQTQSLFDASTKGIPHFIYTDSTVLANQYFTKINIKDYIYHSKSWLKLEKSIYQNATLNFVSYNEQIKSIVEHYSCDLQKVKCVNFGANSTPSEFYFNDSRWTNKHILFSGIDWKRKGGPDLIEVFKLVLKKVPDAKLTILGYKADVDLPNCNVVGRVPLEQVEKYYKEASVFFLPSKLDYNGVVCIEALMYKLPVVTSNIGAFKDFIINDKNGYLCEPSDIECFASALINLLNDPSKCKEFGEYGFKIASENYTWENTGKLIKIYITKYL